MTRQETLQMQYEDALFALLMEDVAAWNGENALREKERLGAEDTVPRDLHKRCERVIRRQYTRTHARRFARSSVHVLDKMMVVVLVLALTLTVTMAAFPAFRAAVLNLTIEVFDDHETLHFSDPSSYNTATVGTLVPGWLPEGFTLSRSQGNDAAKFLFYENGKGGSAALSAELPGANYNLDNENGVVISTVTVNGSEGRLYDWPDYRCSCVLWADTAHGLVLTVDTQDLSVEDTLRIAENLTVVY